MEHYDVHIYVLWLGLSTFINCGLGKEYFLEKPQQRLDWYEFFSLVTSQSPKFLKPVYLKLKTT